MQSFRIFISSPRDVGSERALAARVIDRLQFEFRGLIDIAPVFWEQMPMRATDTFQAQIPQAAETDLCIFILWSWFGTPLPETFRRPDGRPYASGTEFEFESALDSHSSKGTPDILVYRKTAELRTSIHDREQVLERLAQRDAVQSFIERYFKGEGGSFKAAFREFESPADFEEMLEVHLRELIRGRLHDDAEGERAPTPLWAQSPFRGLQAFDLEHALIYCGRTRAVTDLLDALRHRAEAARPLVLVIGTSGSGKSSLVRAGVLPLLMQPRVIEEVVAWRHAVLRPSDAAEGGPMTSLAAAFLQENALPDLAAGGTDAVTLADVLRTKPAALLPSLALVLDRVAEGARQAALESARPGPARLVLIVDQLEELFSATISQAERNAFAAAVAALARSGLVWVIAILRSDSYPRCSELPDDFGELIRGDGTHELRPPRPAEIAQMIRRPALIAGLSFERHPEAEEGLDDVLRDAAAATPAALPLLQFALDELYKRRSGGMLRFSDYEALGGLEGALRRRAEEEFEKLPEPARAALPATLSALVRIGLEDDMVASRRVPRGRLTAFSGAVDLADAFVTARLFVADRTEGGEATIGVAHEALLGEWPRARSWIDDNKELLRTRARVAAAAMIWEGSGRDPARLLPPGRALAETEMLLRDGGLGLSPATAEFITASQGRAAHRKRRRRQVYAVAAVVLAAMLSGAAWYYDGYIDTKVSYATNFSKKMGVFFGVGQQLTEAAAHHRGLSFKFYTAGRYGSTKRMEAVNGHGACPQTLPIETYLGQLKQNSSGVNTFCRTQLSFDQGRIAGEFWFDRNSKPVFSFIFSDDATADFHSRSGAAISMSQSGASRVHFTRITSGPQQGNDQAVHYLDAYGRPEPDRNGRYGQAYQLDDHHQLTRITALGEDDQPTLPRNAPATIKLRYDDQGNVVERAFFDERGAPMRDSSSGAPVEKIDYDIYGNAVAVTLLDETGKPVKGTGKYARQTLTYNEWGDVVEVAYWDRYGQPVLANSGYAKIARQFDDQGRWTEEDYFAENGSPIAATNGSERLRASYDAAGNLTELLYLDHNGNPVTLPTGFARITSRYDDNGYIIAQIYLDKDGAPIDLGAGYAQVQLKVDAEGRPVESLYLDKRGRHVMRTDGYAKERVTYDSHGNPTSTAYFDTNDKPAVATAGWARKTLTFDDRGNVVEEAYFDANNQPARIEVGYSIVRYTFDARGNQTEFAYYTGPGQLINKAKGCPKIDLGYDDRREQINWSCRDANGDLVLSPVRHYARRSRTLDPHGNETEEAFFDDRGQPMRDPAQGFAAVKFSYDDDGNLIEAKFFDENTQPIAPPKIACTDVVLSYDKGRRTGRRCLDTSPTPAPGGSKG